MAGKDFKIADAYVELGVRGDVSRPIAEAQRQNERFRAEEERERRRAELLRDRSSRAQVGSITAMAAAQFVATRAAVSGIRQESAAREALAKSTQPKTAAQRTLGDSSRAANSPAAALGQTRQGTDLRGGIKEARGDLLQQARETRARVGELRGESDAAVERRVEGAQKVLAQATKDAETATEALEQLKRKADEAADHLKSVKSAASGAPAGTPTEDKAVERAGKNLQALEQKKADAQRRISELESQKSAKESAGEKFGDARALSGARRSLASVESKLDEAQKSLRDAQAAQQAARAATPPAPKPSSSTIDDAFAADAAAKKQVQEATKNAQRAEAAKKDAAKALERAGEKAGPADLGKLITTTYRAQAENFRELNLQSKAMDQFLAKELKEFNKNPGNNRAPVVAMRREIQDERLQEINRRQQEALRSRIEARNLDSPAMGAQEARKNRLGFGAEAEAAEVQRRKAQILQQDIAGSAARRAAEAKYNAEIAETNVGLRGQLTDLQERARIASSPAGLNALKEEARVRDLITEQSARHLQAQTRAQRAGMNDPAFARRANRAQMDAQAEQQRLERRRAEVASMDAGGPNARALAESKYRNELAQTKASLRGQVTEIRERNRVLASREGQTTYREQAKLQRELSAELRKNQFRQMVADLGPFAGRLAHAGERMKALRQQMSGMEQFGARAFAVASGAIVGLGGLANPFALERFKLAMADLGAVVGRDLVPYLEQAHRWVRRLADTYLELDPGIRKAIGGLTAFTAAGGAALFLIPKLVGAAGTLLSTMGALSAATLTNPIGLIAAGLGTGLALIMATPEGRSTMADVVQDLGDAFKDLGPTLAETIKELKPVIELLSKELAREVRVITDLVVQADEAVKSLGGKGLGEIIVPPLPKILENERLRNSIFPQLEAADRLNKLFGGDTSEPTKSAPRSQNPRVRYAPPTKASIEDDRNRRAMIREASTPVELAGGIIAGNSFGASGRQAQFMGVREFSRLLDQEAFSQAILPEDLQRATADHTKKSAEHLERIEALLRERKQEPGELRGGVTGDALRETRLKEMFQLPAGATRGTMGDQEE